MSRFVLLDHSLKGIGGHHFDYALHVLRAAESQGYETVLASNRRFRGNAKLPASCRVFPLFRFHTYSKYTIFAGNPRVMELFSSPVKPRLFRGDAVSDGKKPKSLFRRAQDWLYYLRHRNGPQRRINDFSGACRTLFAKIGLLEGDVVFVPTLSELDLAGLATYLEQEPATKNVDWHLQFHFNIFDGREPDYAQQSQRLERLQTHFQATLARVPQHRLHFYNTSQPLTGQYNRLGVAPFEELPYPINEAFHTRRAAPLVSGQPLRVTCAGGVRAEKGQQGLGGLVRELWTDCFATGRAQLLVQAKPSRFTGRPRFEIPLPEGAPRPKQTYLPGESCSDGVVYIRHPLGIDAYEELIRRADIGLLLYDSVRYYTRRAGILGELLTAGVPVIVPAGCWLAEQIAEPIYQHVERMQRELPIVARLTAADLSWKQGHDGGQCTPAGELKLKAGRDSLTGRCQLPLGTTELAISHRWASPTEPGTYLRLETVQLDEHGAIVERAISTVGHRENNLPVPSLVSVKPNARRIWLTLSNAYDKLPIVLHDLQVTCMSSAGVYDSGCPSGAVGLIAAEPGEAPRLLREMIEHYPHYRGSAAEFSVDWFRRHDPHLTVKTLVERSQRQSSRRKAA